MVKSVKVGGIGKAGGAPKLVKPAIWVKWRCGERREAHQLGGAVRSYRLFDSTSLAVLPIYHFANLPFYRGNWPTSISTIIGPESPALKITILMGLPGFNVAH